LKEFIEFKGFYMFYIFHLGIHNGKVIFKFGITNNIVRRKGEIINGFKKNNDVNNIFPVFIKKCVNNSSIETKFKNEMKNKGLKIDKKTFYYWKIPDEVICLSNEYGLEYIIKYAEMLINDIKSKEELYNKNEDMERANEQLNKRIENLQKDKKQIQYEKEQIQYEKKQIQYEKDKIIQELRNDKEKITNDKEKITNDKEKITNDKDKIIEELRSDKEYYKKLLDKYIN
jgi:hypothetical protein